MLNFSCLLLSLVLVLARAQTNESWGYVDVRPGAHIFWWSYRAFVADAATRPTVLWQQGGPGASGTGYGNFAEMGPLDWNLQPRNSTWLNAPVNLLFVDSPVGAGFSYVDDIKSDIPTTNAAIAADLVSVITAYMAATPAAQTAPFYVFSKCTRTRLLRGRRL